MATFQFKPVDRVPFDLMEGCVWLELMDYFTQKYNLQTPESVLDFLQTDFRWVGLNYIGPQTPPVEQINPEAAKRVYTNKVSEGPLAFAETVQDVESYKFPDPSWFVPADYAIARQKWGNYAIVFVTGWMPLFWGACEAFGMEQALMKMHIQPKIFEAFIRRKHEFYMDILSRVLEKAAKYCDICWLGDDYAGQQGLIFSPNLWRKLIKPYLAEQVALIHKHGLYVLFHSCGNIRAILPDLIDIGVNAHLVFQTTAKDMDASSIAREFGGHMVFYGGIDVQHLLSFGTTNEVMETVKNNIQAFEKYGGYIVANSHHGIVTIKGENIEAMCMAAREKLPIPR